MNSVFAFIRQKLAKIYEGDSTKDIIIYWLPELISSMILIILPTIIDSLIVANAETLSAYGTLAMSANIFYALTKFAESIPIAAIAIIGRFNGAKEYDECGSSLGSTFWLTVFIGLAQLVFICFAAQFIFRWLGVPSEMIELGIPFLRLKSVGIFLIFTQLGIVAFMRGVKNTTMPMLINVLGIAAFIFFDYALVLGKFGFPRLSLHGSAFATIIQYLLMNIIGVVYVLWNPDYKKYFKRVFFFVLEGKKMLQVLNLSWPIIIDKVSWALCYVWLSKMIATMGTAAIATYDVVKNLERFSFLPVMAASQVITFLVSNRLGASDHDGASANIKKVLLLACVTVGTILLVLCIHAPYWISFFDPRDAFTDFAVTAFRLISPFVFFDLIQVILAGALRGSGDVRVVMWARFFVSLFVFIPGSYLLSLLPISNELVRFCAFYCSYLLCTGIVAVIYFRRILSHKWQKSKI